MSEIKVKEAKISTLTPDDINANKGTEYGHHLMDKSFRELGAGRSILLDKNNRIIAGNKSVEVCGEIGMDDVIIIETDGTKLVAVKRTDIDLDSEQGRNMALADNATSKANLEWDAEAIAHIQDKFDIDASDWGVKENTEDIKSHESQKNKYTAKIEAPTYEPKGEKPLINELINLNRYHELISEINGSKLTGAEKDFLKLAASRHIVFDYSKIAEYYAHCNKEAQNLFENSALVIIDFDKAIELGYVKLRDDINEAMIDDYGDEA